MSTRRQALSIGLLGASFNTGNMGVSALAESSIKCIISHWPDAKVVLLGHDRVAREYKLKLFGREVRARTMPIRFCKNVFLPCHFLLLLLNALLMKVLPWKRFKDMLSGNNPYVKMLLEMNLVFDITGGDSFSDIYGLCNFMIGSLRKLLVLQFGKKLVFLPQTYGPFKSPMVKLIARYILSHASIIYSRDRTGVQYVRDFLNNRSCSEKVRFAPDVAFILDRRKLQNIDVGSLKNVRRRDSVVVGLNVSGLLFNGGYTQDNMFGLKTDYRRLIHGIIDLLMKEKRTLVLLVPHVFHPLGNIESDSDACLQVYETLNDKHKGRVFLVQSKYNHNEIKYIIGMCDFFIGSRMKKSHIPIMYLIFFIGSRMHACIAALSQCIPAVGLAYSKKFWGVFETVGAEQLVMDMRRSGQEEILMTIANAFEQRRITAEKLRKTVPDIQGKVLNVLRDVL